MRQIVPYSLWLGHVGDVRELRRILASEFAALVDLAINARPTVVTRALVYCRFPLIDGAGNPPWLLRAAIQTTTCLLQSQTKTLLYCGARMSRTPAVAAATIALLSGRSPDECLAV